MSLTLRGAARKFRLLLDSETMRNVHLVSRIMSDFQENTGDDRPESPVNRELVDALASALRARARGDATEDVFSHYIGTVEACCCRGAPDDIELPDVLDGIV